MEKGAPELAEPDVPVAPFLLGWFLLVALAKQVAWGSVPVLLEGEADSNPASQIVACDASPPLVARPS